MRQRWIRKLNTPPKSAAGERGGGGGGVGGARNRGITKSKTLKMYTTLFTGLYFLIYSIIEHVDRIARELDASVKRTKGFEQSKFTPQNFGDQSAHLY